MAQHIRDVHGNSNPQQSSTRKTSVSTIVSEFQGNKRKADGISPPSSEPEQEVYGMIYIRDVHGNSNPPQSSTRKTSVATILSDFEGDKRKADVISPPSSEAGPKREHLKESEEPDGFQEWID